MRLMIVMTKTTTSTATTDLLSLLLPFDLLLSLLLPFDFCQQRDHYYYYSQQRAVRWGTSGKVVAASLDRWSQTREGSYIHEQFLAPIIYQRTKRLK